MTELSCGHIPMRDFKASAHEWICSGCGKVGVWDDGWSYFGALGCLKCGLEPVIHFVACSEVCRLQHEAGKRVVSKSLTADALRRVDEQIENLQRQRGRLAETLEKAR